MKCFEIDKYLPAFLEKELELSIRQEVKNHLDVCEECRSKLNCLEKTLLEMDSLKDTIFKAPYFFTGGVMGSISKFGKKKFYTSALTKTTEILEELIKTPGRRIALGAFLVGAALLIRNQTKNIRKKIKTSKKVSAGKISKGTKTLHKFAS
ncbi:hypothetical protein ES703_05701 [subsurface metagenome]